jgi:hypothetical protein
MLVLCARCLCVRAHAVGGLGFVAEFAASRLHEKLIRIEGSLTGEPSQARLRTGRLAEVGPVLPPARAQAAGRARARGSACGRACGGGADGGW